MFTEERESDVVKKVRLPENNELFLITLIEHKSSVDNNVIIQVFERVIAVYLRELNLSEDEIAGLTDQIKERKMGRLFEHFEGFDLPAMREEARIAKENARIEGLAEGRAEGLEEGEKKKTIELVCRKLRKGKEPSEIANELDEDLTIVENICNVASGYAPDYDIDKILEGVKETTIA